jgi:FtsZ-interacting cell division protein ZipA
MQMPTEAMPVTALAVLCLLAAGIGIIGALITALLLTAVWRERRDIRRAKAIAKAKKEMKDRVRRLKEEEAHRSVHDDLYFEKYQEIFDGL